MGVLLGRCYESQFDSIYPMGLNGVISPMEFEESIGNINRAGSARKYLAFYSIFSSILLFGAIALLIAAGTVVESPIRGYRSSILFGIGWALFGLFAAGLGMG